MRRSLGREFGWLWAAFAVSVAGTWLAFDAFPLIAILVLHASPTEVSVLAATGLAVGAVVAIPLGPWLDLRRKRPVMIGMDLVRFGAMLTVPAAYLLGWLTFAQLLVVSVVVAAADITFLAASGACLKTLVRRDELLVANARFESTQWTATMLGPPLGGALIGLLGPVTTVLVNAVSFVLSAAGIRAIGPEPSPAVTASATQLSAADPAAAGSVAADSVAEDSAGAGSAGGDRAGDRRGRVRAGDLLDGWRFILRHPVLRRLFANTILVNGLIMATAPLLAVLLLGRLGFTPWQYGLAFAVPCVGGLVGSRLSRPLVARLGQRRVLLVAGALRVCWSVGLAFVGPGVGGLVLVMAVEFGLITCSGVYSPVLATYRLDRIPTDRVARTLSAWSVSGKLCTAALTALWGLLATVTGPRTAIAVAGLLMLLTPILLPRTDRATRPEPSLAGTAP